MRGNLQENQGFINDARARGLDVLAYYDWKSQRLHSAKEPDPGMGLRLMLLAGHPESIRILGEILDDYETMWGMAEKIMGAKGESEHA